MTEYVLPEVVDLASARGIADELAHYIRATPTPVIEAGGLSQAGVPLLQILVAARRLSDAEGKPLAVRAAPDGMFAALCDRCGLDRAFCGAMLPPVPPVPPRPDRADGDAADPTETPPLQRT